MTPNQRLMLAVSLSVIFFVGYTAIFPPPAQELADKTAQKNDVVTLQKDTLSQTHSQVQTQTPAISTPSLSAEKVIYDTNTILSVKNKDFLLKVDTLGRISSKELLQERFNTKDDKHAQLIPQNGMKPLYIRFLDDTLNAEATAVAYTSDISDIELVDEAVDVTFTQELSSLTITKKLRFYPDGHYDVDISLSQDKRYFIYLGQRPKVNETEQMMTVTGAMVFTGDQIATIVEDGDAEGRKSFSDVKLISAFDQYSASIIYGLKSTTNVIIERDRDDNPVVYFDATQNISFNGYIGQKEYKVLDKIDPVLTNAIEYGWFTFASKPLFQLLLWLHSIFGNWGWSIIALTLMIRAVLYPLTFKGMMSMQKIKEISPQIKELQAKHKADPQRMNAAVMDMYKKHNANPLGGCLPMLLQIPVFFAIYRVLLNAVELQGAPWMMWITDLSRMDEYFIMPILMGASMYYQQKLTPNNFTDPMQEKVFKYLPVIFTFFFITFPSGLVLYWFVNNLFSIGQQFIVNAQFKNAQEARKLIKTDEVKKDD